MNLQRVGYLFADEGHYVFGAIMSKIDSSFSLAISHLTITLILKTIGQQIVLPQWSRAVQAVWELFNSNLGKNVAPSEYLTTDENYILCNIKLLSVNTILTGHTSIVFY